MKRLIFALAMLAPGGAWAERYSLRDVGDFQPSGQRVEFYDRFGWRGYEVDFDFGLDEGNRMLSSDSRLKLRVQKRDGGRWNYTCKAKGRRPLIANINFLWGKGISVVVECRVDEKAFAKAVGMDPDDVGNPTIVFHAMIQEGQVTPGPQRGLYFEPTGRLAAAELGPYTSKNDDPSSLTVLFRSAERQP
ncbi:MAG TPA: hypothetical protein DEB40_08000 [Elusimicrobia bacterium]|nr:hypothetical protein [Elusimicrobiota bacterium]HBT61671.1 hypothetical protein [Elusimicrobiota bacterium]